MYPLWIQQTKVYILYAFFSTQPGTKKRQLKLLSALCPGNCASSSKQISRPWSSKRLRYMRFTIGVTRIAICTPPKLNPEAENDVWMWLSNYFLSSFGPIFKWTMLAFSGLVYINVHFCFWVYHTVSQSHNQWIFDHAPWRLVGEDEYQLNLYLPSVSLPKVLFFLCHGYGFFGVNR